MRGDLFKSILVVAVLTVAAFFTSAKPVSAQPVTCTVSRNNAPVLSAPAILAPVRGELDFGDTFEASEQGIGFGGPWLSVTTDLVEGWIRSAFVSGCSFAALPQRQSPAQQPALAGLVPPADQTGPSQPAIFLPDDVETGVDGLHVFTDELRLLIDPSIKAFELGVDTASVDMRITDESGTEIYSLLDEDEPFCLFVSQTASCESVWSFAQTGYRWPVSGSNPLVASSTRIDPNQRYSLGLDVTYSDGDTDFWNWSFRIIPSNTPPRQLYHVVDAASGFAGSMPFGATEVRIRLDTLASADFDIAFNDRMVMELAETSELDRSDPQIGSVQFVIRDGADGEVVFSHTERQVPYCLFGNTQTTYCDAIWRFTDTGNIWPQSDAGSGVAGVHPLLENHTYEATVAVTDDEGNPGNRWGFEFEVAGASAPTQPPPPPVESAIEAAVVQYGPGSTASSVTEALAFQIQAYDTAVGTVDGDGIAQVDFRLLNPGGTLVWQRLEGAEPFCLFSNASGANACNVWNFAEANMRWPNGDVIDAGQYTVRASVSTDDGRTKSFTYDVDVQLASRSEDPAPAQSNIVVTPVQVSPGSLSATVSQALAFQLAVHDTGTGNWDGAGIAEVKFQLVSPSGSVVYERTESGAPYCLFSNPSGDTTCNVWTFPSALNRWPSGQSIRNGQHILVATVTTDDGRTGTYAYRFNIDSSAN